MRHKDVYIHSVDLLAMWAYSPHMDVFKKADLLGVDTEIVSDGYNEWDSVVDPDCWVRVSWPEHVINPQFNSDATYNLNADDEVKEIAARYNQIHADSVRRL